MENIVNKIGVGLEMTAATLMMFSMIGLAKTFPVIAVLFFIGGLLLWNEIIRDSKKGGAR